MPPSRGDGGAPAFLRGAVAAFTALLIARMNRIIDGSKALNAIADDETSRAQLKTDIPRLKRRAALWNNAVMFATMSAIATSLLVIVAFVSAFFQFKHEYGVALLFVLALIFFTLALVDLVREARLSLHELN